MAYSNTRGRLFAAAALVALTTATAVRGQEAPVSTATDAATTVEALVISPEIIFRNRTTADNPVLAYDLDYFQRFEPVSVGEMLKRVPGVTFTSDVLEFDGVSMRGLPPGYTKVTINGRRAPGGDNDGSFFVDRIPAELVERIEIIRSPSADQPSDGLAGTLNIVLKEGANLEGGFAKVGALINEDGVARGSAALAYAGGDDDTHFWVAGNYQGRRNPKEKVSVRYDGDFTDDFKDTELQSDTRDGVDISLNGEFTQEFDFGRLRFTGLVIDTDRDEDETSLTYEAEDLTDFDEAEIQAERIGQRTYSFGADGKFDMASGVLDVDLAWNRYNEDTNTTVFVTGEEDLTDQELDEYVELDVEDTEWDGGAAYTFGGEGWKLKSGVDYLRKTRDFGEVEFDIDNDQIGDPDPADGAVYNLEETRIDPFVRVTFDPNPQWTIDMGVRYETIDRDVTSTNGLQSFSDERFAPSLHVTYRPSESDQLRFSVARTIRRPGYDLLAPYLAEEEPADEDYLQGNPLLKNETALGFDLGYEHRMGARGIFGVNAFYRDIDDLIETRNTGANGPNGGDIYEPQNLESGKTWGVELDLSTPLDIIGLPNTGFFFNYTWLDSEVRDPVTGQMRPFFDQPTNVYNIGFIHTVEAWNSSFGASLYDRDMGYETGFDELGTVDYDGDLEAFFEKRIGDRYVLRFAAMNLLDKEKRETYLKYDGDSVEEIIENQLNGDVDEAETESERSGVLYQLTLRSKF